MLRLPWKTAAEAKKIEQFLWVERRGNSGGDQMGEGQGRAGEVGEWSGGLDSDAPQVEPDLGETLVQQPDDDRQDGANDKAVCDGLEDGGREQALGTDEGILDSCGV